MYLHVSFSTKIASSYAYTNSIAILYIIIIRQTIVSVLISFCPSLYVHARIYTRDFIYKEIIDRTQNYLEWGDIAEGRRHAFTPMHFRNLTCPLDDVLQRWFQEQSELRKIVHFFSWIDVSLLRRISERVGGNASWSVDALDDHVEPI